jgi:hypothetical protein
MPASASERAAKILKVAQPLLIKKLGPTATIPSRGSELASSARLTSLARRNVLARLDHGSVVANCRRLDMICQAHMIAPFQVQLNA